MYNHKKTILAQYANSPRITGLIARMNEYFDQSALFEEFRKKVWDVSTAVGFGLDIWGVIVGVSRDIQLPAEGDYFGYKNADNDWSPFNDDPFYGGISGAGTYKLLDESYRTLIMLKAMANISATTVPVLNRMLQYLFAGRGRCYVNPLGNMRLRYTFEFALSNSERAIILHSGVFPAPMGVQVTALESYENFGFQEAGDTLPFNDGILLDQNRILTIS